MSARLPRSMIHQVEEWAARNDATRSEAIRRLVEIGLAETEPLKRRSPKAVSKASDLAGQQIDKLANSSASVEEQQKRKRRLLKGPEEFRDIRGDISKPKG